MDLGVAGCIAVKLLKGVGAVNKWLAGNPDTEIVDMKLSNNGIILIIYRREEIF